MVNFGSDCANAAALPSDKLSARTEMRKKPLIGHLSPGLYGLMIADGRMPEQGDNFVSRKGDEAASNALSSGSAATRGIS
jgi:hypothetical protein